MSDLRKRALSIARESGSTRSDEIQHIERLLRQAMAEALEWAVERLEAAGETAYDIRQMAADLRKDEGR